MEKLRRHDGGSGHANAAEATEGSLKGVTSTPLRDDIHIPKDTHVESCAWHRARRSQAVDGFNHVCPFEQ